MQSTGRLKVIRGTNLTIGGSTDITRLVGEANQALASYAFINGQSEQEAARQFWTEYFGPTFEKFDELKTGETMAGEEVILDETSLPIGDQKTRQYLEEKQAEKKSPIASLIESVIPSVAAADFKSKEGQETLIRTINNFVDSGVKIKPQQFLTLSKAVAEIESRGKGKTAVGTSTTGGIYYGTYQMGKAAIGDAAADLKEVIPDHKTQPKEYKKWVTNTFLNDEDMQERFYGAYTNKSNKHLMNVSSKYRKMSIKKKLEMLAGAQLGMGNVVKFINGDKSFKDGNGKGIQYFIDRYIKYRDSK